MSPSEHKMVVLYHKDCLDGFGGAWTVWRKLGNKARYIPVEHGFPPPGGLKNKIVYAIDFTYPQKETGAIRRVVKELIPIDHHISVKKIVESLPSHSFSSNHSGSVLTWSWFYPKTGLPKLLSYIQDIDLWKFKLPEAKRVAAYLRNVPYDFKLWNRLARDFENPKKFRAYIDLGDALLKYDDKTINDLIAEGYETNFEGHRAFVVNSSVLNSEIGSAIVKCGYPIAIIWYVRNKMIHVSLRSSNKVDVSKIALRHGGGGHHSSAGFEVKLPAHKELFL